MSSNEIQPAVRRLLGDERPDSLLILGDLPEIDWQRALPPDNAPVITRVGLEHPAEAREHGRQDLVAVGNVLEHLARRDGEILLAGLRDLYARRVLLRLIPGSTWHHTRILSFGFTQLARVAGDAEDIRYYGFDVSTYKTTPDWLNARYWANPELFDRYRW